MSQTPLSRYDRCHPVRRIAGTTVRFDTFLVLAQVGLAERQVDVEARRTNVLVSTPTKHRERTLCDFH